jgi:O-antigen/teichoic acid export membrane protein
MSELPVDGSSLVDEPSLTGQGLSLRDVVRRASGLSAASIFGAAVSGPTMFLAGRWLGPVDFGRAQFVLLVYFYASLFRSGMFDGGMRTFIDRSARGDVEGARRAEEVGYSGEVLVSLVPGIALFVAAAFAEDNLRRLGFALAPIAVMASSLNAFLSGRRIARQQFPGVARASVVRAVVACGGTLAGIAIFGPAAVFVAPIVADVMATAALAIERPRLSLGLRFDRAERRTLLRVGFPLGAAAVVYWAYRTVGSASIAVGGDAHALGIYTFAAAPVAVALRLFASLQTVLMPGLWTEMAADVSTGRWQDDGRRLTVFTALLAGFGTNVAQALVPPLVTLVASSFAQSIPVFEVLVVDLFVLSVAVFPSLVLDSATVNKQTRHLSVWVVALGVNVAANAVVLLAGGGPLAVAWNDIWVQGIVVVAVFEVAMPYIGGAMARWDFYLPIALVAVVMAAMGLGLHAADAEVGSAGVFVAQAAVRIVAVAAVWAVVTLLLRSRVRTRP